MSSVIIVCSSQVVGGGELFTVDLTSGLNEIGVETSIATDPRSPLAQLCRDRGVPVIPLVLGPKLSRKSLPALPRQIVAARRALRELVDQYTDSHFVLQYKLEELLWPTKRSRYLVMEHGPIPGALLRNWLTRKRLSSVYRTAVVNLAISEAARHSFDRLQIPSKKFNAGINTKAVELAMDNRESFRQSKALAEGKPVYVFASRIETYKGINEFLHLLSVSPEVQGVVAGEGSALLEARKLASRLDCDERIQWLGHVTNSLQWIAAGDLLVFPTSNPTEGRPLAVLEALAVGTPVLGSEHPVLMAMRDEEKFSLTLSGHWGEDLRQTAESLSKQVRRPAEIPSWTHVASDLSKLLV